MSIKVVKFGGSSLADAGQMKKVKDIVLSDPDRKYVIVSAPGKRFGGDIKVTDLLYSAFEARNNAEKFEEVFGLIKKRYEDIISELGIKLSLSEEFETIKNNILKSTSADYSASRGEFLNAIVFSNYIGADFLDPAECIIFNDNGLFDSKKSYANFSAKLSPDKRIVIPGFYGVKSNGEIKTFSRGGSDITGSIVTRAVNADLYENWTDVSGMLMADPRIVDNPNVIKHLTYKELRELSYMGAEVLHEDAVFPVREVGIPINIKNTNKPEDKGTIITAEAMPDADKKTITGIAGKKGFSSITIEKDMMNSEVGFGRKVLQILEDNNVAFEHITSGIDSIGIIVQTSSIKDVKNQIIEQISKSVNADTVAIEDEIALIAVVGMGMIKAKGTAAKVFSAVASAGINIKLIDQGLNELNIILGVGEQDYADTLNAIYKEFN